MDYNIYSGEKIMMMQDEEEMMDDVSLLPFPVVQSGVVSTSHSHDENNSVSHSPHNVSPKDVRSIRWYRQLLKDNNDIHQFTSTDSTSVMIATVCQHYQQLRLKYSDLLELLSVRENDIDNGATIGNSTNDNKILIGDKGDESDKHLNDSHDTPSTLLSLDPLSAIVQEEDAKINRDRMIHENYQRDKLRRIQDNKSRGGQTQRQYIPDEPQDLNDPTIVKANAKAYLQLIMKDLKRLSSPYQVTLEPTSETATSSYNDSNLNDQPRMQQLKAILYLFAISHPDAGYIQGMHEIASYCLYIVEIENEGTATNSSEYVQALSYWFTEQILTSLYIAYDVTIENDVTTNNNIQSGNHYNNNSVITRQPKISNNKLLQMSNRIVQYMARIDPMLYATLQSTLSSSVPYQLIFTKWIRLLFGREVIASLADSSLDHSINRSTDIRTKISHVDTVIFLWDALFESVAKLSQKQHEQQMTTSIPPLQIVAEYYCVARLWHHKYTIEHLQQHSTTGNNYLLHWFMNIPPESGQQVQFIVHRMNYIMQRQYNLNIIDGSSDSLPPFHTIPSEILAMTNRPSLSSSLPYASDKSSTTSTMSGINSIWDSSQANNNSTSGPLSFFHNAAAIITSSDSATTNKAFSSFTETIAAKTQSIQKLIAKEWEQVQSQIHLDNHPLFDTNSDDVYGKTKNYSSSEQQSQGLYNLNYYEGGMNSAPTIAPHENSTSLFAYVDRQNVVEDVASNNVLSEQLQHNLNILQQYLSHQHEVATNKTITTTIQSPPNNVWVALSNIQQIQQSLQKEGR